MDAENADATVGLVDGSESNIKIKHERSTVPHEAVSTENVATPDISSTFDVTNENVDTTKTEISAKTPSIATEGKFAAATDSNDLTESADTAATEQGSKHAVEETVQSRNDPDLPTNEAAKTPPVVEQNGSDAFPTSTESDIRAHSKDNEKEENDGNGAKSLADGTAFETAKQNDNLELQGSPNTNADLLQDNLASETNTDGVKPLPNPETNGESEATEQAATEEPKKPENKINEKKKAQKQSLKKPSISNAKVKGTGPIARTKPKLSETEIPPDPTIVDQLTPETEGLVKATSLNDLRKTSVSSVKHKISLPLAISKTLSSSTDRLKMKTAENVKKLKKMQKPPELKGRQTDQNPKSPLNSARKMSEESGRNVFESDSNATEVNSRPDSSVTSANVSITVESPPTDPKPNLNSLTQDNQVVRKGKVSETTASAINPTENALLTESEKLLKYCKNGDWPAVESLLRYHKDSLDLNISDENGFTALCFAVKHSKLAIAEKFTDLGARANITTSNGQNLAHIAAAYNTDDSAVKFLVGKRISFTAKDEDNGWMPIHSVCGRSGQNHALLNAVLNATITHDSETKLIEDNKGRIPFLLACEAGSHSTVIELLKTHTERQLKYLSKQTKDSALHLACRSGNLQLVKMLLERGADVNCQNAKGETPFHVIAEFGQEGMLRLFHTARAKVNLEDNLGRTPLHIATEFGHTGMVEILIDKFKANIEDRTNEGSTLMHLAAQNGHPETALVLLKRGVALMMPNKSGYLGLHMAAMSGHTTVVRTLLQKGTNVDIETKLRIEGFSALHIAVQYAKLEVIEQLLGYGANVNLAAKKVGLTPLHIAAGLNSSQIELVLEILLKSGAEANATLKNGETCLHIACQRDNTNVVAMVLDEGTNPMLKTTTGETALHVAAKFCNFNVIKTILEHFEASSGKDQCGRLINTPNSVGETVLHYAAKISDSIVHRKGEDVDLIKILLEYGGEIVTISNETQETCLHYSASVGNEDVLTEMIHFIGPGMSQIYLNKQSKVGWSPLLCAAGKGHLAVVRALLKNHARVDVFDEGGKTALHLAAENGHAAVADALLLNKAFVNSKTKLGVTPLHLASMKGHQAVVQLLINQFKAAVDALSLDNQTPLHYAAKYGQIDVCSLLISLGANTNARDARGQSPLHLAAESDYPEIVKLFLKMKPDITTLLATDENGLTCAHIAATKGSLAVVKELMDIDITSVIEGTMKGSGSTALHLAASGGHNQVVKMLIDSGTPPLLENTNGMTAIHIAAQFGKISILDVYDKGDWTCCSQKTGLSAAHIAAHYGQTDFLIALLRHISPSVRSEKPESGNPFAFAFAFEDMATDYGLTPLHMAAQSGHEQMIRLLLNFQTVQVDTATVMQGVLPIHLAAINGHIAAVGLLLSRSTRQLHFKDVRGRLALHLAAGAGKLDMCALLLSQGSNINSTDQNGWTSLHYATKAGHIPVVQLLLESGADPLAENKEGKIPLCFAASFNHFDCLSLLMKHEHHTEHLLEDRAFVHDLMICGKNHDNKSVQEFCLVSQAPIDTAVKLSSIYTEMSTKEKERAKDMELIADYCEDIAADLLSILSSTYDPAKILKATDDHGKQFLDILIENNQKRVVAHVSVQQYLTEIWFGGINWGFWRFFLLFLFMLSTPPAWVFYSLPLENHTCKAPVIRFMSHLVSHIYLTLILIVEVLGVVQPVYETTGIGGSAWDWLVLLWLSGVLVAELGNPGQRSTLKIIVLAFSSAALSLHITAFAYPMFVPQPKDSNFTENFLYVRNQLFASGTMLCCVMFLDFLTVHHLFGPWAIIIQNLMADLMRFLVVLSLFLVGFSVVIFSLYQPAYPTDDPESSMNDFTEVLNAMFYSLFNLMTAVQTTMPALTGTPAFSFWMLKLTMTIYSIVGQIVLINLLIAMMSATYERIEAQSDMEWKFGRAKLVRQMNKTSATAPPINMFTKLILVAKVTIENKGNLCGPKAQERMRFEEDIESYVMKDRRGSTAGKLNFDQAKDKVATDSVHIKDAVNWVAIVEEFYKYQATNTEEEDY